MQTAFAVKDGVPALRFETRRKRRGHSGSGLAGTLAGDALLSSYKEKIFTLMAPFAALCHPSAIAMVTSQFNYSRARWSGDDY
jgi:hypothetical protein